MFRGSHLFPAVLAGAVAVAAARADTLVDFAFTIEAPDNTGGYSPVSFDVYADIYAAPATTSNNFLAYVNAGVYSNTFIHRSDPTYNIIQGGGFNIAPTPNAFPSLSYMPQLPPIPLQYTLPNTLGTIAMARTSDPNSATSQFFINTADNSSAFGPSNGGGYAVFGKVLNTPSMNNVTYIASLPTYNINSYYGLDPQNGPFTTLPLTGPYLSYEYFVNITSVTAVAKVGDLNGDGRVDMDDILAFDHSYLMPMQRDVNGDGVVNEDDYLLEDQASALGQSAWGVNNFHIGYALGDLNLDGTVDAQDYAILVAAYEQANGSNSLPASMLTLPPLPGDATTIPEPASLAVLASGSLLLIRRRRA